MENAETELGKKLEMLIQSVELVVFVFSFLLERSNFVDLPCFQIVLEIVFGNNENALKK